MFCCLVVVYHGGRVEFVGFFFFQAEDGIRDLVRSRGLGDVYKRQWLAGAKRFSKNSSSVGLLDIGASTGIERLPAGPRLSLIHI